MNLWEAIQAAKAGKIVKVKYNNELSAIWHSEYFVWSETKSPVHIKESNLEGWSVVEPKYICSQDQLETLPGLIYQAMIDGDKPVDISSILELWIQDQGIEET